MKITNTSTRATRSQAASELRDSLKHARGNAVLRVQTLVLERQRSPMQLSDMARHNPFDRLVQAAAGRFGCPGARVEVAC